jgi:predicted DNA-binding transcriptional regulator AlpA
MWEAAGGWIGRLPDGRELTAASREECVRELRAVAGSRTLTIEVEQQLVGVAEAAAVLGWDKRRIFTYLGRGSFPQPVAMLASGRVWRRSDVEAFARTRRSRGEDGAGT